MLKRIWIYAPLGFIAVGLVATGFAAARDSEGLPTVIALGVGLGIVYWLGRRSRIDNTAVAVAEAVSVAVSVARSEAAAAAHAQALNQVAVIVGPERAHQLLESRDDHSQLVMTDGEMIGLDASHSLARQDSGIHSIRDAKAPLEVEQSTAPRIFDNWPFAGAERVPDPPAKAVDGSTVGATLADRGDAPVTPQTPPTRGLRV